MPHVYSTATNDALYCDYEKSSNGSVPTIKHSVLIKGGSNRADKRLFTPLGVRTEVSDDDLAFLMNNPTFVQHKKDGFISVGAKVDAEVAAADMKLRDESAPAVSGDFGEGENKRFAKLRLKNKIE